MSRGKGPYHYDCPECGAAVEVAQAWAARNRGPCRACLRIRNGWTCGACNSSDPHHPYPCPAPRLPANGIELANAGGA